MRPGAQQTDARQSNPNLLLSDRALAHTRPQLEIYADDVKCTHGATVGRLDEEAIFYLRSRAIAENEARDLLITAFAGEVLDRIDLDPLRRELKDVVARRLPAMKGRDIVTAKKLTAERGESARLDPHKLREDFPILGRRVHGKPLVYLDNAASTQKPRAVIEAVDATTRRDCSNVHRGLHKLSSECHRGLRGGARQGAALHRRA